MHILDTYALGCGAKVDKPYIYEQYYPLGEQKYITIQPFSRYVGKQYEYWPEVISYIHPHLEKNGIKIVQIGGEKDVPLPKSIWTQGTTSINQAAYLIKDTMLHVGVDSFGVHVASGYGKKSVALYSTNWAKNCDAYWSRSNGNAVSLEPDREKRKPSFKFVDAGKQSINEIKPELVANHILDLLGVKEKIPYESIFFGDGYSKISIHIVPSSIAVLDKQIEFAVVRMDLDFNEPNLHQQLGILKRCSIITDKPINEKLLKERKEKVQDIVYYINDDDDLDFVDFLHTEGINYILVTELSGEKLKDLKLKYLDYNFIFERPNPKEERDRISEKSSIDNLYFKSNKKILKNGEYFSNVASLKTEKPDEDMTDDSFKKIDDSEEFWNDFEDYYIVKKLD